MSYPQQPQPAYQMNNGGNQYPPPSGQPYYEPERQQQQQLWNNKPEGQVPQQMSKPRTHLNDPIPLALFILCVLGYAAVSGIALNTWVKTGGLSGSGSGNSGLGNGNRAFTINSSTAYMFSLIGVAGLLLAILYLAFVRAFTKIIMEITLALSVALNIAFAVYYWYIKYWSGAIIFTIFAVIGVVSYFSMRRRIPLARLLLQVTMDIAKHHPSVYLIYFLGLLVQTIWSIYYAFTLTAIYAKWTPSATANSGGSSATVGGLLFFATFVYLWASQVIANVTLATVAGGVYGGWYYYGPSSNFKQGEQGGMPKHPSLKAFVRATTTSLGSIAFGSLIVTVLEILRMVFQAIEQNARQDGNAVGMALACVAQCCIGCITSLVEWFNRYAYIEIALFGKAYIPAAKDTWRLMKDRGIDALINDSLVGMCLTWGAYIVAILCAAFGYLYLRYTAPAYNSDGSYSAPVVLFSFLIGLQSGLTLAQALEGGVSTIFVCLGEDPSILAQRCPPLFEEIRQNYPKVVNGV